MKQLKAKRVLIQDGNSLYSCVPLQDDPGLIGYNNYRSAVKRLERDRDKGVHWDNIYYETTERHFGGKTRIYYDWFVVIDQLR